MIFIKGLWRLSQLFLLLSLLVIGWAILEPSFLTVKSLTLTLPRWQHENLKIAVLSDFHIGSPWMTLEKLRTIVATTNAQQPDLTLLLGDYVMGKVPGGQFVEPELIAAELQHLRAKYGVFAILGNHEWWYDGQRVWRALAQTGITVLENQAVKLTIAEKSLWIVGLADKTSRKIDLAGSIAQTEKHQPIILLSHTPDIFPRVPPRVNLTLAGHTHGGQINFWWIQHYFIPSRYGALYARGQIIENNKHLFVTSGLGTTGVPLRLGIPPEIVILTLVSENSALLKN
jgi:uncharacterized protein